MSVYFSPGYKAAPPGTGNFLSFMYYFRLGSQEVDLGTEIFTQEVYRNIFSRKYLWKWRKQDWEKEKLNHKRLEETQSWADSLEYLELRQREPGLWTLTLTEQWLLNIHLIPLSRGQFLQPLKVSAPYCWRTEVWSWEGESVASHSNYHPGTSTGQYWYKGMKLSTYICPIRVCVL